MLGKVRRFIERGRKGYCYEDLWSFDNFLSKVIANALREFKQNCHTYPSDGISWEEWQATLDEMIECFEEQTRSLDNIGGQDFLTKWEERRECQKQKLHRGLELLERYYYDLWD